MAKIRISENELKQIIRESVEKTLNEDRRSTIQESWFGDVWHARSNAKDLGTANNTLGLIAKKLGVGSVEEIMPTLQDITETLNTVTQQLRTTAQTLREKTEECNGLTQNLREKTEECDGLKQENELYTKEREQIISIVKPKENTSAELIKKISQWRNAASQWYAYQKSQKNAAQQQATQQQKSRNDWAARTMTGLQKQTPEITAQPTARAKTAGTTPETTATPAGTNQGGKPVKFDMPLGVVPTTQKR